MSLKLTLDSMDGVDAAIQSFYVKNDDGKYSLDAEGIKETQAALKSANKEAADRRKALDGLKDIDPEEYRRLKAEAEERATKKAKDEGDFSTLKEQMAQKHAQELAGKDTSLAKYRAALEKNLIDAQAVSAIAAAKGIPELLLPHVKSRVKVEEVDGEFTFKILDAKGNPMVSDGAGTPATFGHLIESMKADPIFGRAFEGTGASGGGSHQGGTVQPKQMPLTEFNKLSHAAKVEFSKAGGKTT